MINTCMLLMYIFSKHYSFYSYLLRLQVCLGVTPKNENKNEEMTEILKELHELVPYKDGEATAIALGGDQLTVERARICQDLRKHSFEPKEKLDGFVPFASDWHAEALLLHRITLLKWEIQYRQVIIIMPLHF